jgi:hypothetical protein
MQLKPGIDDWSELKRTVDLAGFKADWTTRRTPGLAWVDQEGQQTAVGKGLTVIAVFGHWTSTNQALLALTSG